MKWGKPQDFHRRNPKMSSLSSSLTRAYPCQVQNTQSTCRKKSKSLFSSSLSLSHRRRANHTRVSVRQRLVHSRWVFRRRNIYDFFSMKNIYINVDCVYNHRRLKVKESPPLHRDEDREFFFESGSCEELSVRRSWTCNFFSCLFHSSVWYFFRSEVEFSSFDFSRKWKSATTIDRMEEIVLWTRRSFHGISIHTRLAYFDLSFFITTQHTWLSNFVHL